MREPDPGGPGHLVAASAAARPLKVLLVEDDDGDALLVEEYLLDLDDPVHLRRATSIRDAAEQLVDVDCVLQAVVQPLERAGLAVAGRTGSRVRNEAVVLVPVEPTVAGRLHFPRLRASGLHGSSPRQERSSFRAWCRRVHTVPVGMPSIAAISSQENPSTSDNTSTTRFAEESLDSA